MTPSDHDRVPAPTDDRGDLPPPPPPAPPSPTSRPPASRAWPALAGIAAIVATVAGAFAWTAGWLTPQRLTAPRMTDAIEAANGQVFPGFRRAHAKGVCVEGHFVGLPAGAALSRAAVFGSARTPLQGRMSIGGGTPYGLDGDARVRSMSLRLVAADGEEWRMAMNSFPFFGAASLAEFHAQAVAGRPDPVTGKPDPARIAAHRAAYPAAARFAAWAADAPWSTSFANTTYNGVNAFRFVAADGSARHVRWSMRPQAPLVTMSPAQRKASDGDFLAAELAARLAEGPLRWDMVATLAAPGDDVADPSRPWPDDRPATVVGTVVIERSSAQDAGACRDVNFDPLILPRGVEGSADPILAARSSVYADSFNRRQAEVARGDATPAPVAAPGAAR